MPQTEFSSLLMKKKKKYGRGYNILKWKKMRHSVCSDQRETVGNAWSFPVLSGGVFKICLFMFDHALLCSCKNVLLLSCFLGENVNEFFSRVAALAFEQSMIKELEKTMGHMAQIGTGNLISMLNFASCVYFPHLCSQGLGRFFWASKQVSQICKHINLSVFLSSGM